MRAFLFIFLLFTLPVQAQLVVLQYHHVDVTTPAITSVSPEQFEQHLQLIERLELPVIDLADALQRIDAGQPLPQGAVAITFDDAYQSIYEHALPALEKRDWPFVVFVNTTAVDENHQSVMSWQQLRDMKQRGATLANHSADHPYLLEQPEGMDLDAWLQQQISQAQLRLEQETGPTPKLFAYPYGEFSLPMTEWLAQQGYKAFGQQSGPIGRDSHPQALPRFPASGIYANPKTLATKLKTLPLPIGAEQMLSPILQHNPPLLTLTFALPTTAANGFQCFASGQGAIPTQQQRSGKQWQLRAQAESAIGGGRFRYNCTAASREHSGWHYWYSQVWINTDIMPR
ncbi:polysaccharide deacetylase [Bacterioplanes sanyensis]|uniref:polysaccharide deacetylase family protein n=1 Tax=Bacterioplanes sanyensis TaxID=1249553 RepID=UPI001672D25A|nr:polysaccharide deacetylase family protein [Bacterioplanes sanyensis]GGY32797.1 polysaccharide deacetylase [Bacterioplanes sanyensis]